MLGGVYGIGDVGRLWDAMGYLCVQRCELSGQ